MIDHDTMPRISIEDANAEVAASNLERRSREREDSGLCACGDPAFWTVDMQVLQVQSAKLVCRACISHVVTMLLSLFPNNVAEVRRIAEDG